MGVSTELVTTRMTRILVLMVLLILLDQALIWLCGWLSRLELWKRDGLLWFSVDVPFITGTDLRLLRRLLARVTIAIHCHIRVVRVSVYKHGV